jgi:hypothetical protein
VTTTTKRADQLKEGDVYRPDHRHHWRSVVSVIGVCHLAPDCITVTEWIIPPSQREYGWSKNDCYTPRTGLNILRRDLTVEVLTP